MLSLIITNDFSLLTRAPSPSPLPAGERDRVRGNTIGCNET